MRRRSRIGVRREIGSVEEIPKGIETMEDIEGRGNYALYGGAVMLSTCYLKAR